MLIYIVSPFTDTFLHLKLWQLTISRQIEVSYFKRCFFSTTGSTGGTITALSFEGCSAEDDDECEAAKGTTVVGQMTFAASAATESLECSIYGIIFGVEIPFPGGCPVVDACSALSQGDCPVEAGEEIVYDLSIKIENIFPAGSVTGKWTLKDPAGNDFVCFLIPIVIT